MALDRRERFDNAEENDRLMLDNHQSGIWTAIPGIVQSFDASRHICNVQPSIQSIARAADGSATLTNLPMLLDCPVLWQGGGGVTLTFPINPGDECLVVFSARGIDNWWAFGGIQSPVPYRMHNLSDGFALVGVRSQPRKFAVSTTAAQLRSDDGVAFAEINPASHDITITTSTTVTVNAHDMIVNAANTCVVHAPGGVQLNP